MKRIIFISLIFLCFSTQAQNNSNPLSYIYLRMPEIQAKTVIVHQMNLDFQKAVASNNIALADSIVLKAMPAYFSALETYKQVYINGKITTDPHFLSPMIVTLHDFYNMLIQSMNLHVKNLKKQEKNIKVFAPALTDFIRLVDTYDGYVQKVAQSLFGDQAVAGSTYYTMQEASLLISFFTDSLKLIAMQFKQFDTAETLSDQLYNHALTYWNAYATQKDQQNVVAMKMDFTRYKAMISDQLAKATLKKLDFQNKSEKDNQAIFKKSQEFYNKEMKLYASIKDKKNASHAERQARIMESRIQDYKKAGSVYERGMYLSKNNKIDVKRQSLQLLQQAHDLYHHVGDTVTAQLISQQIEIISGDVSLMLGQQDLQQYLQKANAYLPTLSSKDMSPDQIELRKAEILSGVLPRDQVALLSHASQMYNDALAHYTKANQILVQKTVPVTAPIDLLTSAQKMLSYLIDATTARLKGDQAAQQLSSSGLQQAQLNYQQARVLYQQADALFSTGSSDQFKTYFPLYPTYVSTAPQLSYVRLFNNSIGDYFVTITQPMVQSDPNLVLEYYAYTSAQGVDMSLAINKVKQGVDFTALARTAASQARALTPDNNNWTAQPNVQGYISVADTAWHKAEGLYETSINDGNTDVIPEYISFINEYADQYSSHVPANVMPLLGSLNIYYRALNLFFASPETNVITQLQGYINATINKIKAQITVLNDQVTADLKQNNYTQAIASQEQILAYYTQKNPNTQDYVLGQSADDIKAVFVKAADIYKAWGAYQLTHKDYQNAYNNLSYAYNLYQQLGVTDLQDIRQKFFLSQTLFTAWSTANSVYPSKEGRGVGSFGVPLYYFLKEYVQMVPSGVPTQGNVKNIIRATFIANRLADEGIAYADVYQEDTFDRASDADSDKAARCDAAEKAYDDYQKKYVPDATYTAELITKDSITYIKETNKPIPPVDGPYSTAPTAVGYYLVALTLYKPGNAIISVNGQSFVPGQDADDAWDMGGKVALAFLTDSIAYTDANVKIDVSSLQQFQQLKSNVLEIYNRYSTAQDYFNGKDQASKAQQPQNFITNANALNLVIAQELYRDADLMTIFTKLAQTPDDIHLVVDEARKNYVLARQYYIAYNAALNMTDEYGIDQANKILFRIVQSNDAAGDLCVDEKNYFKSVAFYTTALYYLQQLITHNVSVGQDLSTMQTHIEVKTNGAYFYGANDDVDKYYAIVTQPTVINGLPFKALVSKRLQAAQAGSNITMSNDELDKYNEIEGYILDAITYYMLANDKFSKMVNPQNLDAVTKKADVMVNDFITKQLGISLDKTAGNAKFLRSAIPGYKQFMATSDEDLRYGALGQWAFKLYFSLCEEYISVYLYSLSGQDQWDALNQNINTRLQAVTLNLG